MNQLSRFGLIALIFTLAIHSSFAQQAAQPDVHRLVLGKPVDRELKGGETHSYDLALQAGQFLDLVVDQRGIDIVIALFDPNNDQLVEVDSPNGITGHEPLPMIVEKTGNYRLE